MKLRFHDDSLRLRLSQSDVAQLAKTGRVEETITFAPGQSISYVIESGAEKSVTATLEGNRIRVALPAATAKTWIESNQTGIAAATPTLRVLVEKDFQCLHGPGVEEPDVFPNPMAAQN